MTARQFLETEAALRNLMEELVRIRSAGEQIAEAGSIACKTTEAAEKVIDGTSLIIQNTTQFMNNLERKNSEIVGGINELAKRFDDFPSILHEDINKIIVQNEKMENAIMSVAEIEKKHEKLIIGILSGLLLNLVFIIVVLVLFSS